MPLSAFAGSLFGFALVGMPDRIRLRLRPSALGQHEGFGRAALACLDLLHGPPGGDRAVLRQNLIVITRPGKVIPMFDQQPVGPLAVAIAIVLDPHEHPAPVQLIAIQA